jgi:hypothetical protein
VALLPGLDVSPAELLKPTLAPCWSLRTHFLRSSGIYLQVYILQGPWHVHTGQTRVVVSSLFTTENFTEHRCLLQRTERELTCTEGWILTQP